MGDGDEVLRGDRRESDEERRCIPFGDNNDEVEVSLWRRWRTDEQVVAEDAIGV